MEHKFYIARVNLPYLRDDEDKFRYKNLDEFNEFMNDRDFLEIEGRVEGHDVRELTFTIDSEDCKEIDIMKTNYCKVSRLNKDYFYHIIAHDVLNEMGSVRLILALDVYNTHYFDILPSLSGDVKVLQNHQDRYTMGDDGKLIPKYDLGEDIYNIDPDYANMTKYNTKLGTINFIDKAFLGGVKTQDRPLIVEGYSLYSGYEFDMICDKPIVNFMEWKQDNQLPVLSFSNTGHIEIDLSKGLKQDIEYNFDNVNGRYFRKNLPNNDPTGYDFILKTRQDTPSAPFQYVSKDNGGQIKISKTEITDDTVLNRISNLIHSYKKTNTFTNKATGSSLEIPSKIYAYIPDAKTILSNHLSDLKVGGKKVGYVQKLIYGDEPVYTTQFVATQDVVSGGGYLAFNQYKFDVWKLNRAPHLKVVVKINELEGKEVDITITINNPYLLNGRLFNNVSFDDTNSFTLNSSVNMVGNTVSATLTSRYAPAITRIPDSTSNEPNTELTESLSRWNQIYKDQVVLKQSMINHSSYTKIDKRFTMNDTWEWYYEPQLFMPHSYVRKITYLGQSKEIPYNLYSDDYLMFIKQELTPTLAIDTISIYTNNILGKMLGNNTLIHKYSNSVPSSSKAYNNFMLTSGAQYQNSLITQQGNLSFQKEQNKLATAQAGIDFAKSQYDKVGSIGGLFNTMTNPVGTGMGIASESLQLEQKLRAMENQVWNQEQSVKQTQAVLTDLYNTPDNIRTTPGNIEELYAERTNIERLIPNEYNNRILGLYIEQLPAETECKEYAAKVCKYGYISNNIKSLTFNDLFTRERFNYLKIENIGQAISFNAPPYAIQYFNKLFNDGVRLWDIKTKNTFKQYLNGNNWEISLRDAERKLRNKWYRE